MRLHFRMGGKSRTQYGVLYLCEFRFDPIRYASTIVYEMLLIQSWAKHWPFLVCLKFEKPANVWPAKWARLFSKFLANMTIFKVSRSYECLIFPRSNYD